MHDRSAVADKEAAGEWGGVGMGEQSDEFSSTVGHWGTR